MKLLSLLPKSSSKVFRGERELSVNDVEEIPRGLTPGEWVILSDRATKKSYVGYCNPFSLNFFNIKVVHEDVQNEYTIEKEEKAVAWTLIQQKLIRSLQRRKQFDDYSSGARLVYGVNDSLPGIIVDKYKKYILIQINTAGMDRFRDEIKSFLQKEYPDMTVILFDNADYRKAEVLPIHETAKIEDMLEVSENGLSYNIPSEVVQKIGYYYDHRENRNKLKNLLLRSTKKYSKGLDLFSYVGSWGLHLLAAGVESVHFVDQAAMEKVVLDNVNANGYSGKGRFTRKDVFKFLDDANTSNEKFDVIVSDPPAFTKSEKNKSSAIQGYEKLHQKAMKLLEGDSLFIVASCTHYVSFIELDKTVQDAAMKNAQKIQLLDIGLQGFDHPVSGLTDKGFYIKYLAYAVSRG